MISQLRHALDQNELVIYYQPQFDVIKNKIIGVEALVRWQHPEKGFLMPKDFISLAEDTGLIVELDRWVFENACRQIDQLHQAGFPDLRLCVNVSERDLRHLNFLPTVQAVLEKMGIDAHLLELELSENIVFQASKDILQLLSSLAQMGVRISIDDFGTGFSSLNQLTQIPLNALKIDQTFTAKVTDSPKDAAIVSGILNIARDLEIDVIAEGIENKDQLDIYQRWGCKLFQGHFFSPAVSYQQVTKLLQADD